MEPVQLAAILAAVVVLASMLSVELGIAVALFELGLGVVVGNVFDLHHRLHVETSFFIGTSARLGQRSLRKVSGTPRRQIISAFFSRRSLSCLAERARARPPGSAPQGR
jgi:hypothetical protein